MSLKPPETARKLQEALHTKAKGASSYRFYALYDKVYRGDVLRHAYERCRANRGVAGVDGQTFADIEVGGLEPWLDALTGSAAYQAVMNHACWRLRQWLACKNGARVWASRCPDRHLHATLGWIDLAQVLKARRLLCANV